MLAGCGAAEEEVAPPRAEVKSTQKAELPPLPKPRPKLSEPVAGLSHAQLVSIFERALRAVEVGGRLDVQSETKNGERTTRVRLSRD